MSRAERVRDEDVIASSASLGTFLSACGPALIVCQGAATNSSDQRAHLGWLQRTGRNETVTSRLNGIHHPALLTATHRSDTVALIPPLFSFSTKWDADQCKFSTLLRFPSFVPFFLFISEPWIQTSVPCSSPWRLQDGERSKRSNQYRHQMEKPDRQFQHVRTTSQGFIFRYVGDFVGFVYSLKFLTNEKYF